MSMRVMHSLHTFIRDFIHLSPDLLDERFVDDRSGRRDGFLHRRRLAEINADHILGPFTELRHLLPGKLVARTR